MTMPLLTTKLHIPPLRPKLVPRSDLVGQLNVGLYHHLTLISAPAGFGKTTLLSEWIHGSGLPVAWISLDEEDNDAIRFWTYLVAALRTVHAGLGQSTLQVLQSPQRPPAQAILIPVLNEIAALPDRMILVLDDYHVVSIPAIHEGMAFLLEHQPQQLHLVLSTRADPPLPISRLRARGQLTELRADDLRFGSDETAAFLNAVMGLDLAPEDVNVLQARTEGWVVGLQLAALSMQGRADRREFVSAFAGGHHYILEYLTEEVLRRQPEPVQRFLLQTSVLDRLCGPLCNAVTGDSDGGSMLSQLQGANLFITPLDDEQYWYRYHRLFADLLGNLLRKEMPPESILELHRRASTWHEQNGSVCEAMRHALASGDSARAARLIEHNAMTMTTSGEVTTLMNWVKALPRELVRSRPLLCIIQAWESFFSGQMDTVEHYLHGAEQRVQPDDPSAESRYVLGHVATLRAFIADRSGNGPRAIEFARTADELLPREEVSARSVILYILGRAYRLEGDLRRAIQACAEVVRIGREAGNILTVAMGMCEQATLRKIQGQLRQAADLYEEALQLASEGGDKPLPLVAIVDVGLSDLLYERNDLKAAGQRARRVVEHLEGMQSWGMPTDLVLAYTTLARVRQAQGSVEGAFDALRGAEQARRRYSVFPEFSSMVGACRIKLWLTQGDLADAMRWTQDTRPGASGSPLSRELEHIALARVLIAAGRAHHHESSIDEALRLLTRLAEGAEAGRRRGRLIEILVLQAMALHATSATGQALTMLEKSLSLAEPEGIYKNLHR